MGSPPRGEHHHRAPQMRDQLLLLDSHPIIRRLVFGVRELEAGLAQQVDRNAEQGAMNEQQEYFSKIVLDAFGELRPILDAVDATSGLTESTQ
jgi:hypothetical protein